MSQELDARLVALEIRQAFQDDTLQTLNDVLIDQQRQIERLQHRLEVLAARQETLQSQLEQDQDQVEPPPPHY